jgi:hypothetical protein
MHQKDRPGAGGAFIQVVNPQPDSVGADNLMVMRLEGKIGQPGKPFVGSPEDFHARRSMG